MKMAATRITRDETAVLAKLAEMLDKGEALFDDVHLDGETEYEAAVRIRDALKVAINDWEAENLW